MRINNVSTPKTTGYAATVSLGLATASGISKNKCFRKVHKPFAYVTAALTFLHLGVVEYYHHKFKNGKS